VNKHFTASAVVLHKDSVLLVHHPRLKAWVPPGGHIEPNELPDEAAVREVLEETGVPVEIREPLCIHQVKAFENGEHVYHIDIVYLCQVVAGAACDSTSMPQVKVEDGIPEASWVKLEQLESLNIAANVSEIVQLAYSKWLCKKAALRP
jgi:ADP-ribose pyrophosphatase YjhB (NUDIX family)